MKGLVSLLVLVFIFNQVINTTADKICESSEDASVHPHETDCTKFYECSHGQAAELTCPNGLHFNPKEGVCDWPEFAGCTTNTA